MLSTLKLLTEQGFITLIITTTIGICGIGIFEHFHEQTFHWFFYFLNYFINSFFFLFLPLPFFYFIIGTPWCGSKK